MIKWIILLFLLTVASISDVESVQRIISLAPHATENLFAAGADGRIVGVVDYSDFPRAAQQLPRVGSYDRPDLETVMMLKPDLVVAWHSGNPPAVLERLRGLGIAIYVSQPQHLDDIATDIANLGRIISTTAIADVAAQDYRQRLAAFAHYTGLSPIRVFYQVWDRPLLTVGGTQIINEVIRLCGGENIFAHLLGLTPNIDIEAVLVANPEVIVASGMGRNTKIDLEDWRGWPQITAVSRDNLFVVSADLMQRPTPRLLDGAEQLCRHLVTARSRRPL